MLFEIFRIPFYIYIRLFIKVTKYFANVGLSSGKFLTTFLITYLLECEGLKKDEIEENGKFVPILKIIIIVWDSLLINVLTLLISIVLLMSMGEIYLSI